MRPRSITIIGVLYIIGGVLSIWDVISDLFRSHININFAVCLLFVGIGLLKLKDSSRGWAIFWIVLGYILSVVLFVGYFAFQNFSVKWNGAEVHGPLRPIIGLGTPVVLGLLLFWVHSILRCSEIVAMFRRNRITEPNIRQVSSEPAPSASPDEPST